MVERNEQAPVVFWPTVANKAALPVVASLMVAPFLWPVLTGRVPVVPSIVIVFISVMFALMVVLSLTTEIRLEEDAIVVSGVNGRRIERSRVVRAEALNRSILVSVEGEASLEIPCQPRSPWTKNNTRATETVEAIHDWAGISETVLAAPKSELPQDAPSRTQAVLATWEPSTLKAAGAGLLAVFLWLGLPVRLSEGSNVVGLVFYVAFVLVASVALFRAATSTITLQENEIIVKGVLRTQRVERSRVHSAGVGPSGLVIGVRGEKPIQAWAVSKGTLSTLSKRETSADGVVDAINNWAEG